MLSVGVDVSKGKELFLNVVNLLNVSVVVDIECGNTNN